jgi:hypothetical protein
MDGGGVEDMSAPTLAANEVRSRGVRVLLRELGAAGMVQFMQQFRAGQGDYTKERHKVLRGLTVDAIVDEIKRKRAKR